MHFDKGQPLYIIEVMKMFNTVRAPFSGTLDKIIIQGGEGSIVQKGQPLFKITPDEKHVEVDPRERGEAAAGRPPPRRSRPSWSRFDGDEPPELGAHG